MKRRSFLTLLGGAAAAWPLAARAQQRPPPVIGYFGTGASQPTANFGITAFRKGLNEMGYVEGRNLAFEYRWAENQYERLPEMAMDLVRRRVSVIAAPGSMAAALAAKAVTTAIPIVFSGAGDPVQIGLVASLNRPGGNVTGITSMNTEIGEKRFGLLRELLPSATRFGVLLNPSAPTTQVIISELRRQATAVESQMEVLEASSNNDIDAAFASLAQKRIDALLVSPQPLFSNRRVQLVTLAVRYAIPVIYPIREDAEAGGLMSYGASNSEVFRQVGVYAGRILRGEKAADLPVMRATKFDFIINRQTAKLLNITVPPTLLAIADEVIE
jgi:putative ABC transport system substrate-binding protein